MTLVQIVQLVDLVVDLVVDMTCHLKRLQIKEVTKQAIIGNYPSPCQNA